MTRLAHLLRGPLGALALTLLVVLPSWQATRIMPLNIFDQPFYLGIAYDLLHDGRFTDGFAFAESAPDAPRPSGMRFAPLYPAFVAGAAALEPAFRAGLDCVVETHATDASCPRTARLVRWVQVSLLVGVYLMLWWAAGAVTSSRRAAWIALVLALATAPYLLRSVAFVMTETFSLFLSTGATAAAVAALRGRRKAGWMAVCGLALGLLTMTRPAFLYLFLPAFAVGGVGVLLAGRRIRAVAILMAFAAGFVVPTAPWVVRNAVVLDRPALTFGYGSHTLVQRLSYDAMTWQEYPYALLCGLPDGPGLARMIAGPGRCHRFELEETPDTFYAIGIGPLMKQTVAAAGGWERHMHYLITNFVLADPVKYLLVTIPMTLRGAWIDHYWGLVLGPICLVLTVGALRRREAAFLLVALPAWFMLLFHGAVAVNQPRYNLMLVLPFAVAGAVVIERALARRRAWIMSPGAAGAGSP